MLRITSFIICLIILALPATAAMTKLDEIVAIVDESVITQRDLANRVNLVRVDFQQSNRQLPDEKTLQRQVLEALINDSLLLQEANRRGIKITDSQLNQTMQRIARQNNLSLSDYRQTIIADGVDYDLYRETVRRELIISALRRQYSQRNAIVTDSEVEDFLERNADADANYEYQLAHILIAVPDAASPEQVNSAQEIAQQVLARLDQGEAFEQMANTFSTSDTALQGGDLGWRKKAEIPSLFTDQVLKMQPGDYAGPIRSASGFHIVHLKQRRDVGQKLTQQTRSRHILIRPNELVTEEDAQQRLAEFRRRILAGEDFERLARLYSVDYASGTSGGDIGWKEPGATVAEYQAAIDELEPGEISEPFRTQFGWHIAQVIERRTIDETAENRLNKIKSQLLQQKQREVFDLWKRQLRDEAFVVFPDRPDA